MLSDYIKYERNPRSNQCDQCKKNIKTGDMRVKVRKDIWRGTSLSWKFYHRLCFWKALSIIIKRPKGKMITGFLAAMKLMDEKDDKA